MFNRQLVMGGATGGGSGVGGSSTVSGAHVDSSNMVMGANSTSNQQNAQHQPHNHHHHSQVDEQAQQHQQTDNTLLILFHLQALKQIMEDEKPNVVNSSLNLLPPPSHVTHPPQPSPQHPRAQQVPMRIVLSEKGNIVEQQCYRGFHTPLDSHLHETGMFPCGENASAQQDVVQHVGKEIIPSISTSSTVGYHQDKISKTCKMQNMQNTHAKMLTLSSASSSETRLRSTSSTSNSSSASSSESCSNNSNTNSITTNASSLTSPINISLITIESYREDLIKNMTRPKRGRGRPRKHNE